MRTEASQSLKSDQKLLVPVKRRATINELFHGYECLISIISSTNQLLQY